MLSVSHVVDLYIVCSILTIARCTVPGVVVQTLLSSDIVGSVVPAWRNDGQSQTVVPDKSSKSRRAGATLRTYHSDESSSMGKATSTSDGSTATASEDAGVDLANAATASAGQASSRLDTSKVKQGPGTLPGGIQQIVHQTWKSHSLYPNQVSPCINLQLCLLFCMYECMPLAFMYVML